MEFVYAEGVRNRFWVSTTTDELLGVAPEKAASARDRLLGQIEASLTQIGDDELQIISVELKAVADWSNREKSDWRRDGRWSDVSDACDVYFRNSIIL